MDAQASGKDALLWIAIAWQDMQLKQLAGGLID
jgi:hypothetical protein